RPGMTAILSIPVASAENVLAVPLAAVFFEEGERYVFVKKEEKFEHRPVLIGITDYSFAEVQEGLVANDIVSLEQPSEFRNSKSTNGPTDNRLPKTIGMGGTGIPNSQPGGSKGIAKPDSPASERPGRKPTGS